MDISTAHIWIQNIGKISFQLKFVHERLFQWTIAGSQKIWISPWEKSICVAFNSVLPKNYVSSYVYIQEIVFDLLYKDK